MDSRNRASKPGLNFPQYHSIVRCNNAIMVTAFQASHSCKFSVRMLLQIQSSVFCWKFYWKMSGYILKGHLPCYYVHIQSVLMVNIVNWSNQFLSGCYIDWVLLLTSWPEVSTCTGAQRWRASDAHPADRCSMLCASEWVSNKVTQRCQAHEFVHLTISSLHVAWHIVTPVLVVLRHQLRHCICQMAVLEER